jgi:hypothetical protein
MRSAFLRLLAFFAVMLMPFGMVAVPAASPPHHQIAMPMQHCPEQDSTHHSTGTLANCTMACASALPATDLEMAGAHPVSESAPRPALIAALAGIELEIATPPPRQS